jgi:hypothetical protein
MFIAAALERAVGSIDEKSNVIGEKRHEEWAHGLVWNGWGDNSEVLEP